MTKKTENSSITLIIDGEHTTIDAIKAKTIIESAEESAVEAPHACKKGMCTKCMATLIEGAVEMEETKVLSDEQKVEGKILTCISRPKTSSITLNYDL